MVTKDLDDARKYLTGKGLTYERAEELSRNLQDGNELSLARRVIERIRQETGLIDGLPADAAVRRELCQREALLTSKDSELPATFRHDRALKILQWFGDLDSPALDADTETLGIAGGILKRRWNDLGQLEDLRRAGRYYERGKELGEDAYTQINAAFIEDLLANAGDHPDERRARARSIRELVLEKLPKADAVSSKSIWFNTASRAEALFGLERYTEATAEIANCSVKRAPWKLETTARQIATIARLQQPHPLDVPEIRAFFHALLPGAADAIRSVAVGKVGLALSGGGYRASLYHLGVLARLAELNVLRHVDVLSCVSGGSIVGACYWLMLRERMLQPGPLTHDDYISLVQELIKRFLVGVEGDLRPAVQPTKLQALRGFLFGDKHGALDPEATAKALDGLFYRRFMRDGRPKYMHELPFTPSDHDARLTNSVEFHAGKHNWLRANKVPVLVLNSTTMNTGHAWQFTPTWMGESPWAVHQAADSVPRLEWAWYAPDAGWQMEIARAVAASACVPGVFAPMRITSAYDNVEVELVDGGVADNQGALSLLALNCNVVLVSDACGQLLFEEKAGTGIRGLLGYAMRSMSTLMERVRLASYADLAARQQTGLLRGLMFLHMKAGLEPDVKRRTLTQESYELRREALSPAGVRKDFQQALAELRTDLDAFTPDESYALMACGYEMASLAFQRDLARLKELSDPERTVRWIFAPMAEEITSTKDLTARRTALLEAFRQGSKP